MVALAQDMTGRVFGQLTVLGLSYIRNWSRWWLCLCACGNQTTVEGRNLRNGGTLSCGCLKRRRSREKATTHGQCNTPRWRMWVQAKGRAKKRGLPFNLRFEDMPEIPERCPILGFPLCANIDKPGFDSPTLDRILPALGYVVGNVQIISHRANAIKSDATAAEVALVAAYMQSFRGN